jgi:hypothetical protein
MSVRKLWLFLVAENDDTVSAVSLSSANSFRACFVFFSIAFNYQESLVHTPHFGEQCCHYEALAVCDSGSSPIDAM